MTLPINADLPPISFDPSVLEAARRMKQKGLGWDPKKGSFVWDPGGVITVPSPFPNNVYFILNLNRFLPFFENRESMAQKLVWLPTIGQALAVGRMLRIEPAAIITGCDLQADDPAQNCMLALYGMIENALGGQKTMEPARAAQSISDRDDAWIRDVMHADLGPLDHLPPQAAQHVWDVYREAGHAYLGWRRIQENQPSGWLPHEPVFEPMLMNGLRHFFSDYQHTIRALGSMRGLVYQLAKTDAEKEPDRHAALVAALSGTHFHHSTVDGVMQQIMGLNMTKSDVANTLRNGARQ